MKSFTSTYHTNVIYSGDDKAEIQQPLHQSWVSHDS